MLGEWLGNGNTDLDLNSTKELTSTLRDLEGGRSLLIYYIRSPGSSFSMAFEKPKQDQKEKKTMNRYNTPE